MRDTRHTPLDRHKQEDYPAPMPSLNDARLAILNHIVEFFMVFTPIDDANDEEIDALVEEASEQADLLMQSMGLEITESTAEGKLRACLILADVETFIEAVLDQKFVENVEV